MAKKIRLQLKELQKGLVKVVRQSLTAKKMTEIGKQMVIIVRKRTKSGFGVSTPGGNKAKLKPLSASYKLFRGKNKKHLGEFGKVGKSNLTFTDQMLASLDVTRPGRNVVTISPLGRRTDGLSNKEVAQRVHEAGRPFMNLSRAEENQLIRFYRREFTDLSRKRKRR